ncbi:MAG: aspartate aminotransferase family protein [Pseudomonadota bacterium]
MTERPRGRVLERTAGAGLPRVVSARGLWMRDDQGREYLDAVSGGAAVACLGHGEPRLKAAIDDQLDRVGFAHGSFFGAPAADALAELLISDAPEGLTEMLPCSGGSEAVESALKLARQYWVEEGRPEKRRVISRRQSYHGATLGALSVGGNMPRRELYAPMLFEARFIEPCYAYRLQWEGESEADYGRRAAQELEAAILEAGPESVAAFVAEPVVGATLGCAPAVEGYLREIRAICNRHDVLLILDEVMCGAGRTGFAHACLEDGVAPDLLVMAKGLGAGAVPVGAVLVSGRVAGAIRRGGALRHGFTYMGHPVACAAALAAQTILREDGLLEGVRARGARLRAALEARLADHPHVGDIRGRGLFLGVELVRDRACRTPFRPELRLHARLKAAAMARGLMIYPSGGTIDGRRGDHVLLAPAFVASGDELDEIAARLAGALDAALEEIGACDAT